MIKLEETLAVLTGYNVKMVEKSGTQLSRLFQRVYVNNTCHWEECPVCTGRNESKPSKCRVNNVVYEAVCLKCEEEIKRGRKEPSDLGRYIGESSRTLSERSKEHIEGLQAYDYNNFIDVS